MNHTTAIEYAIGEIGIIPTLEIIERIALRESRALHLRVERGEKHGPELTRAAGEIAKVSDRLNCIASDYDVPVEIESII